MRASPPSASVSTASSSPSLSSKSCQARWTTTVNTAINDFFETLTTKVIHRPWVTIGVSILIALILSSLIVLQETETRPEQLFTPTDSEAVDDRNWVDQFFGEYSEAWDVFFRADASQTVTNVLDDSIIKAGIVQVIDVRDRTLALEAPCDAGAFSCDVNPVPFSHVCINGTVLATGQQGCLVQSVGDYFDNDVAVVNALTPDQIRAALTNTSAVDAFGRSLNLNALVGGAEMNGDGTQVVSAQAFAITGVFELLLEEKAGEESVDPETFSVGLHLYNQLFSWNDEYTTLQVLPLTEAANEDASSQAITNDFALLVYGYMLLIVYTLWVLGNREWAKSRAGLGFAVVVSVMMAIGSTFGLVGALGVKFNNVVTALIVILLGLGVDDAFVLIDNYEQLGELPDMKARLRKAVGRAGSSILATSVTDLAAFAAGTSSVLGALRSFCIYAAVGILFDFLFQITFFVACLQLDNERRAARKPDVLCCAGPLKEGRACCGIAPLKAACRIGAIKPDGKLSQGVIQDVMETHLPNAILSTPGKVIVIVLAMAMLAVNAVGMSRLETQFSVDWFASPNDKIQDVFSVRDTYFAQSAPLTFYTGDVDYFGLQSVMSDATDAFETCSPDYLQSGSVLSWHREYTASRSGSPATDANDYYTGLATFLQTDVGASFVDSIVWRDASDPTQGIVATATQGFIDFPSKSLEQVDLMNDFRDCVDAFPDLEPRAWTFLFVFLEGIAVIEFETLRNVIVAGVAVLVVSLIILADVWAATLVFLLIGVIDVNLLGFLYWTGLEFNSVTAINIVLSIGLSVDYSMHVAHSFLVEKGTRDERAAGALAHIGRSVWNGGVTTFLAIVVLVFSQSYIFEVFFLAFSGTILFGQFHGLVFLPVILSLVGPPSYQNKSASDRPKTPPRKVQDIEAGGSQGQPKTSTTDVELTTVH